MIGVTFLATIACALATQTEVNLISEASSASSKYNNLGFQYVHEGAGINYANLVTGYGYDYVWDDSANILSRNTTNSPAVGVIDANVFQFSVVGNQYPTTYGVDSNKHLTVNGSADGFYAAVNLGTDPDVYGYSKQGTVLVLYYAPGTSNTPYLTSGNYEAIKIKVSTNATTSSTTIPFNAADATSTKPATAAATSAAATSAAVAPSSAAPSTQAISNGAATAALSLSAMIAAAFALL